MNRPHTTVVLAMSADGKIADVHRSAARFPSAADKAHLEAQVAQADATLFGAGTLRAYGTTLPVTSPDLLVARQQRQQRQQPIQIVCSATGVLDRQWRFFQQPIPRWLITTPMGETTWLASQSKAGEPLFEQRLVAAAPINWSALMHELKTGMKTGNVGGGRCVRGASVRSPINRLTVMGGGELVASLLSENLIDELFLTICPLLIGGDAAPTPVGGVGFTLPAVPQLALKSSWIKGNEVFLHYGIGP